MHGEEHQKLRGTQEEKTTTIDKMQPTKVNKNKLKKKKIIWRHP